MYSLTNSSHVNYSDDFKCHFIVGNRGNVVMALELIVISASGDVVLAEVLVDVVDAAAEAVAVVMTAVARGNLIGSLDLTKRENKSKYFT